MGVLPRIAGALITLGVYSIFFVLFVNFFIRSYFVRDGKHCDMNQNQVRSNNKSD